MKRFLIVFLGLGLVLLVYGVVRSADALGDARAEQAGANPSVAQQKAALDKEYQRLIGPDGDYARTKKEVRQSLVEADRQLRQVLSGNSKRLIEKANRKPRLRSLMECPEVVRREKAESAPAVEKPQAPAASVPPADADEPQTPIVRSLLGVLDEQDPQQLASPQPAAGAK